MNVRTRARQLDNEEKFRGIDAKYWRREHHHRPEDPLVESGMSTADRSGIQMSVHQRGSVKDRAAAYSDMLVHEQGVAPMTWQQAYDTSSVKDRAAMFGPKLQATQEKRLTRPERQTLAPIAPKMLGSFGGLSYDERVAQFQAPVTHLDLPPEETGPEMPDMARLFSAGTGTLTGGEVRAVAQHLLSTAGGMPVGPSGLPAIARVAPHLGGLNVVAADLDLLAAERKVKIGAGNFDSGDYHARLGALHAKLIGAVAPLVANAPDSLRPLAEQLLKRATDGVKAAAEAGARDRIQVEDSKHEQRQNTHAARAWAEDYGNDD